MQKDGLVNVSYSIHNVAEKRKCFDVDSMVC